MPPRFNVLITSVSKKVPLVKAVHRALLALDISGYVIGADTNPECLARYFVNEFWQMPHQSRLDIDTLLEYCMKNEVKAIIPTRDGELPFFAKYRSKLQEHGVACLISYEKAVDVCRDKLLFAQYLSKKCYPGIPTSLVLEEVTAPYVVKERLGAGARNISLNVQAVEAKAWAKSLEQPIFQPYVSGQEYSVDLYVDRSGVTVGVIARLREYVVNGESQITRSVSLPSLEKLCVKLSEEIGLYGHVVYQVLCDRENRYHIIECNPRFGGASTLSIAMGLNSFEWFLLEALGRPLPPFVRAEEEKRQVRYAEDLILDT